MGKLNLKKFEAFGEAKVLQVAPPEAAPMRASSRRAQELDGVGVNTAPRIVMGSSGGSVVDPSIDEKILVDPLNHTTSTDHGSHQRHGNRRNAMPKLKADYEHAECMLSNTKALLQPVVSKPALVKKNHPEPSAAVALGGLGKRRGAIATLPPTDLESLLQNTRLMLQKVPPAGRRRASIPPTTPRTAAAPTSTSSRRRQAMALQRRHSFPGPAAGMSPSHNIFNYPFLKPTPQQQKALAAPLVPFRLRPVKRGPKPASDWQMEMVKLKPVQRGPKAAPDWEMEQVNLKHVQRDFTLAEREGQQQVNRKPIPRAAPTRPPPRQEPEPVVEEKRESEPVVEETMEPEPVADEKQEPELEIVVVEEKKVAAAAVGKKSIKVGTSDVYVALTVPNCLSAPSDRDYEKLAKTTQKYFANHLKKKFDTFQSVDVTVRRAKFNQMAPGVTYNVGIEWDIHAEFENSPKSPDRHELCRSLVKANLMKYLTKHCATCFKTPFKEATGVFIQQVNTDAEEEE